MAGLKHTETIRIESLKLAIAEASIRKDLGVPMSGEDLKSYVEDRAKRFESIISEDD